VSGPALPADQRPFDDTPVHTEDLPDLPTRDRNISVEAWIEAPDVVRSSGRIGPWLLWRAGPARRADARYVAVHADDLSRHHTFRLFPDGAGDGTGPSGVRHTRFRAWKEDLLGRL